MSLQSSHGRTAPSLIALSALVTLVLITAAPASAKPKAVLVEPVKDFEVVAKGETLKHSFEIRNEGDEVLEITEVRPSCGCTVAKFDKRIAPGKTGRVTTDVETTTFDGPIAKTVAVFTNDADNAKLQLTVKADVRPYIAVIPGYARFSYVQGEKTGSISQTLFAPDGTDIEIEEIKAPMEYLQVRHRVATEEERDSRVGGKQWKLDIEILDGVPVGALRDYVEVIVDHPKQKKVLIPVSGFVRPRQHVTPQVIDLGSINASDLPTERGFVLTNFITKGIELKEIETKLDGMEFVIEQVTDTGHRFRVLMRMKPDMPKGELSDTLRIHITDDKNPVVEVPFKVTII